MSRMSTRSILDSLEVRKQEIFMFKPKPFFLTFEEKLFLGLVTKKKNKENRDCGLGSKNMAKLMAGLI